MRLYLSSFDVGNATADLVALAPAARVALIMNALDNRPEGREKWRVDQSVKLSALGFSVSELDLRRFFGDPDGLRKALRAFDMVWINGGNVFILRRAMKLSGLDAAVAELLSLDRIVYAGFSAAAVILARSLEGLDLVDDPFDVPAGYPQEVEWTGLGILPFSIVVHHRSSHTESAGAEREIEHYERKGIAYQTLQDGEALLMSGGADTTTKVGLKT